MDFVFREKVAAAAIARERTKAAAGGNGGAASEAAQSAWTPVQEDKPQQYGEEHDKPQED